MKRKEAKMKKDLECRKTRNGKKPCEFYVVGWHEHGPHGESPSCGMLSRLYSTKEKAFAAIDELVRVSAKDAWDIYEHPEEVYGVPDVDALAKNMVKCRDNCDLIAVNPDDGRECWYFMEKFSSKYID